MDLPEWGSARDHFGGDQDTLDALALSSLIAGIEPDLVHFSHVFEGYSERVALPSYSSRPSGQVLSATLYDLIPYRFPEIYLVDENFARWYAQRVRWLRNADLLLSISESSRSDAIAILDLDPSKIVTIYGGVSNQFRPHPDPASIRAALLARYGVTGPNVILYTGGDDHRKNIAGAIQAFAVLPTDLREMPHRASGPGRRSSFFRMIGGRAARMGEVAISTSRETTLSVQWPALAGAVEYRLIERRTDNKETRQVYAGTECSCRVDGPQGGGRSAYRLDVLFASGPPVTVLGFTPMPAGLAPGATWSLPAPGGREPRPAETHLQFEGNWPNLQPFVGTLRIERLQLADARLAFLEHSFHAGGADGVVIAADRKLAVLYESRDRGETWVAIPLFQHGLRSDASAATS